MSSISRSVQVVISAPLTEPPAADSHQERHEERGTVGGVDGVPDVTFVVLADGAFGERLGAGPLPEMRDLVVVTVLTKLGRAELPSVANATGLSRNWLRGIGLPRLVEEGHVTAVGGTYRAAYRRRSPAAWVASIRWRGIGRAPTARGSRCRRRQGSGSRGTALSLRRTASVSPLSSCRQLTWARYCSWAGNFTRSVAFPSSWG